MNIRKVLVSLALALLVGLMGCGLVFGVVAGVRLAQGQDPVLVAPTAAQASDVAPGSPLVYTKEDLDAAKKEASADALKNAPAAEAPKEVIKEVVKEVPAKDSLAIEKFDHSRSNPQEPKDCKVVGMCPVAFDVSAGAFTSIGGAPMIFKQEKRLYDAGAGQYQIWVFTNPTTRTLSISMEAWSGSNILHGWSPLSDTMPLENDLFAAAYETLLLGKTAAVEPGNCDIDGCDPELVGYIVWECTSNDVCNIKHSYNPAQNKSDDRYMPESAHNAFMAIPAEK